MSFTQHNWQRKWFWLPGVLLGLLLVGGLAVAQTVTGTALRVRA